MADIKQRRAGIILLSSALACVMMLLGFFPSLLPAWAGGQGEDDLPIVTDETQCSIFYYALNPDDLTQPNPNKETPGAVGTPVEQRDEAGIKAELRERRACDTDGRFDPTLTASHYADWSAAGLTSRPVAYSDIDAFAAEMVADPALYSSTLTELESLENGSTFSLGTVSQGIWSIYMVPDGNGGVITKQGQTQNNGTTATFTHPSGAVIEYRLECGFQIVNPEPFPGPEDCTTYCAPPPVVPPTTPPETPVCVTDCGGNPPPSDAKDPADDVTPPPGVAPRPAGPRTTGQESEQQHQSGDVSGNVTEKPVATDKPNVTTPDTGNGAGTGVAVGGATPGGDDHKNDVVDPGVTKQDPGGTDGATSIGGPPAD